MSLPGRLTAIPVRGMGEVAPGDPLADRLLSALKKQRTPLRAGDILVVTHKIVSKAEGRLVALREVSPSRAARRWAQRHKLDPRVVQLALQESVRIVRRERGVLITQTRHGLVCANSGVDVSNVDGGKSAVLLPLDPDASARRLRSALRRRAGVDVAVIISDSFGRPWREGLCEVAIGLAGMRPFRDFRAHRDPHGYQLRVSLEATADSLAAMAGLAGHKLARVPACIIRGFPYSPGPGSARQLIRPRGRDLFR
jgi:coenzyme F420-0:L-glutamate ligase / coenzyme F420-1:gamma-L-glutamate ligase